MVALRVLRRDRVVFVQVEGGDVLEAEPLLAMEADQFLVDEDGGRAGGQAEDGLDALGGALADQLGDLGRDSDRGSLGFVENRDGNTLPARHFQRRRTGVGIRADCSSAGITISARCVRCDLTTQSCLGGKIFVYDCNLFFPPHPCPCQLWRYRNQIEIQLQRGCLGFVAVLKLGDSVRKKIIENWGTKSRAGCEE